MYTYHIIFIAAPIDGTDEGRLNELKNQYPVQSRHKIQEMNVITSTDELNKSTFSYVARLEQM